MASHILNQYIITNESIHLRGLLNSTIQIDLKCVTYIRNMCNLERLSIELRVRVKSICGRAG